MTSMTLKTKDGFELSVEYEKVDDTNKIVVFAHGMTVDKDDEGIFVKAARRLNELGISTIRFDFRAHGKSTGQSANDFTISGELNDLGTIMEFVKKEEYEKVGLAGASFGGGISALYTGDHTDEIDALALANPALDYEKCFLNPTTPWAKEHFSHLKDRLDKDGMIRIGSRQFAAGPQIFKEMEEYFPDKTIEQYQGPMLVVHGTLDSKVSYGDAYKIFQRWGRPNWKFITVDGAEHGFHEEQYETRVTHSLVDFFSEKL